MASENIFKDVISEGKHLISGIGTYIDKSDDYWRSEIEYTLVCIDGEVYGFGIDPDDGYRSYGVCRKFDSNSGIRCDYMFEPQEIIVKYIDVDEKGKYLSMIKMVDAVNGKKILEIGTDFTEDYYPYAIFRYNPENFEINQHLNKENLK